MSVLAFAALLVLFPRSAFAADDIGTLVYCDAAALTPPLANLALGVLNGVMSANGHSSTDHTQDDLAAALPVTAGIGAAVFVVCAPTIHAANGRPLAAAESFGLRVAGLGAGVAATYGALQLLNSNNGMVSLAAVLVVFSAVPYGVGLAVATDYIFLTPRKPRVTPAGLAVAF